MATNSVINLMHLHILYKTIEVLYNCGDSNNSIVYCSTGPRSPNFLSLKCSAAQMSCITGATCTRAAGVVWKHSEIVALQQVMQRQVTTTVSCVFSAYFWYDENSAFK